MELLVVALMGEHGAQHVDHDFVDDGEAVYGLLGIGSHLLVEHVDELAEELLELGVVVEITLIFRFGREEDFEVWVQHVVAEVGNESLVDAEVGCFDLEA